MSHKQANRVDLLSKYLYTSSFYEMPASTIHHQSYRGGLAAHSEEVVRNLNILTDRMGLRWQDDISPIIIGMGHDVCKIDAYVYDEEKKIWKWNDKHGNGHGDLSVCLLEAVMPLTDEEKCCIRWHMGAFDKKENWNEYGDAIRRHPNVLWTHTADMMSTYDIGK